MSQWDDLNRVGEQMAKGFAKGLETGKSWQQDDYDAIFAEDSPLPLAIRRSAHTWQGDFDEEDEQFVQDLRDALIKPVTLANAVTPLVVHGTAEDACRLDRLERHHLALEALRKTKQEHAATDPLYRQIQAVMARQTPAFQPTAKQRQSRIPGAQLPSSLRWLVWAYAFPITVMVALLALAWLLGAAFVRHMNAAAARLPD